MMIKEILKKADGWMFGTVYGKTVIGLLAAFGILSVIAMVRNYDHAREMVKDARWKAEQAAEEWWGTPLSRNVIFKDYRRVRGKGRLHAVGACQCSEGMPSVVNLRLCF